MVSPLYPTFVVYGQSVGPRADRQIDKDHAFRAVHVGALYFGILSPVRPKDFSKDKNNSISSKHAQLHSNIR